MKVLIIDDSPEALAVARARLADEQLDIVCAGSGAAGIEAARRESPDVILLDVDMPDMSGFDVCRALKADGALCTIPVLFLSGSGAAGDKVKGLDLGAVDYVTKPFDAFELRARVRATLRAKQLQDLLIQRANVDPLTGLSNRRGLMERLKQEWARHTRQGGGLAFILGDIDHFKRINDTHGHSVGDEVIREVARTIAGQCRESDLAARYGGEEFAVVVPGETLRGGVVLAERCRQEIEKVCVPLPAATVRPTASFGVADAAGAPSQDALIDGADRALYQAKAAGRNRVAWRAPECESPAISSSLRRP